MKPDLVYDVGMNNGDDTGYYLARGYNVVAIEADPTLAKQAEERFSDAVRAGRLRVLGCAVGPEDGLAQFWICKENSVWNSFDREIASRNGLEHYAVEVPVRKFAGVLAEFGVPYYLKIDIEGYDHHCLAAIDPADRPAHVSWELTDVADLFMVRSKGYNAFKCIGQQGLAPLRMGRRRGEVDGAKRATLRQTVRGSLIKTAAGRQLVHTAARLIHGVGEDGRPRASAAGPVTVRTIQWPGGAWSFAHGSSGPFGDDLDGEWKAAESLAYEYLDYWLHVGNSLGVNHRDWFDVHATTLSADRAPAPSTAAG